MSLYVMVRKGVLSFIFICFLQLILKIVEDTVNFSNISNGVRYEGIESNYS